MLALTLGLLISLTPADSADDLDACLDMAPVQSEPPITWGSNPSEMWTDEPTVSPDSVRAYLSQVRNARECLLHLDPSEVSRPYLGNIMRTFYVETALLAGLRRFPQAHETFEEARSFLEDRPPIPSTEAGRTHWPQILHQNQAFLYYLLGNLSASIEHYLRAYQSTPKTEPGRRAQYLLDIGILHQRTQDYRSAHYYFERTEHLFSESSLSTRTHPALKARILSVRADLLLEQSLNTELDPDALEHVRRMARRSRTLSEPGTERYARTSNLLAETLGYLGKFEKAYRLHDEVRRYARANSDARLHTLALLKLGVLHVQWGHRSRADSVLQDALTQAEGLGDLDYQRRILRALARLHELQGRWGEAERFYREGVAVIEEYRQSLTASQWSMTAFAQWRDVHRGLVRTLLAQDRPREALVALDRSRARHLQDLRTQARVSNQLPAEKRVRFDSLSRALTRVRNRLASSLSPAEETELRNREVRLMAARQQLLDLDSVSTRPTLDTVSASLARQNRALVTYFLDDPWPVYDRPPRSVAFVLTGDTLRTVPLPGLTQDSVRSRVEAISPLFTSRGPSRSANALHFDLRPLHALYDEVYAPVAEHLPAGRPLTVVPDGPLFHLPFSMLVASMPGGRYSPSEARFVLHRRPTSLELAPSLVADTSTRSFDWSQFEPQLAAYGVSDFDTLETVPSALRSALPDPEQDSSIQLPSLPGVERELDALRSTVSDARIALNDDATERAFRRGVRRAGILHVASHAFVNASSPLQNALLLYPDRGERSAARSPRSDGVLFLHELQGQRRRIPLVVLSGCRTAGGTLREGEGMEGLQYAFRAMGAQSTLSALWPVSDAASVDLMKAFYRSLEAGRTKDEALRQAQLTYLENHPQEASPFFWAPLVLYGSPAPVPLEAPFPPSWTWWALGAVGLGALLLLVRYRRRLGLAS